MVRNAYGIKSIFRPKAYAADLSKSIRRSQSESSFQLAGIKSTNTRNPS
jgi:hypothetical protein